MPQYKVSYLPYTSKHQVVTATDPSEAAFRFFSGAPSDKMIEVKQGLIKEWHFSFKELCVLFPECEKLHLQHYINSPLKVRPRAGTTPFDVSYVGRPSTAKRVFAKNSNDALIAFFKFEPYRESFIIHGGLEKTIFFSDFLKLFPSANEILKLPKNELNELSEQVRIEYAISENVEPEPDLLSMLFGNFILRKMMFAAIVLIFVIISLIFRACTGTPGT
ncbi:MAG: hypothetical protein JXR76_28365 [Deltaproteobacteria bacterium]|nr:hypothetical protein [Deltaproteobacteria bacterium]